MTSRPDDPIGPSTSTMALSFAEVQQRLPARVRLEKSLGTSVLTISLKGAVPAVGIALGGGSVAALLILDRTPEENLILGACVGAIAGYFALAYAIDWRRITVDREAIRVRSLPLPMPGDGTTLVRDIDAIDVMTTGSRAGRIGYRVDVVSGTRHKPLVNDLVDEQQALVLAQYIAQEIGVTYPLVAKRPW